MTKNRQRNAETINYTPRGANNNQLAGHYGNDSIRKNK